MPKRRLVDESELDRLRRDDDHIATHAELLAAGVPMATICHRMRPRGPWQWILPGVVVLHNGGITPRQRIVAALKYAGPSAVLTGRTALRGHRVQGVADDGKVHVLIVHGARRASTEFVVVERTTRPIPTSTVGGLPVVASVARAVIDAARRTKDLDDVRDLVAGVVQQRRCTARQLAAELQVCQRRRTGLANAVLTEVVAGIRSVAEARARAVLRHRGVPDPMWNATLKARSGGFIGSPDAYWRHLGVALEIDSTSWHLSPARQRSTTRKHGRYTRHGIKVLPYSPLDIIDDPDGFADVVLEVLAAAAPTVLPDVVVATSEGTAA